MSAGILRNLQFQTLFAVRQFHSHGNPLLFQVTPLLSSDPTKKRKHIDPNAAKKKDEKRIQRLEKGIRRLERANRILKPVEEITVSPKLLREKELRQRTVVACTPEDDLYKKKLLRRWAEFKGEQFAEDVKLMVRLQASQAKALQALREESEELYQAAIQVDPTMEGFQINGPVFTPPSPGYDPPDGEYSTVKKFNV